MKGDAMPDFDVVVISSGAGGLSAALSVARQRRSVLSLEAPPSFGGYLHPFRRQDYPSIRTSIMSPPPARAGLFAESWTNLALGRRPIQAHRPRRLWPPGFPDFEFTLCAGAKRLQATLLARFPQEARGLRRFFDVLDKVVAAMDAASAMQPGPLGLLGFLLQHPIMPRYSRAPYQRLLDEATTDACLQAVLAGQAATYWCASDEMGMSTSRTGVSGMAGRFSREMC
jgi:all-trans-retinol 13,14-reductase